MKLRMSGVSFLSSPHDGGGCKADRIAIEVDEDSAPYAVAGQNVTLYLSGIDPIHLSIGTVLCPTSLPVKLVSQFTAQILVFDLQTPIIAGAAVSTDFVVDQTELIDQVELFHHSMNLPANITKLISISEKGQVIKKNPRSVSHALLT